MCFQFTHSLAMIERIYILCLIIIIKSEVWTSTHCLGLGHETMVCAVCFSIFLWIRDMARLLRGTFVSWWYLPRIWPSVTNMQHFYHARYPTDDWHLAYMFSLVYFSVEVCLVGLYPHSVSTWRDPCVRVCVPLTLAPPLTRKQIRTGGDPALQLSQAMGTFELTHGSAYIIEWISGLLDSLFSTYNIQFMGCVIGRIHFDLKVVFCFWHFTASHYHHDARLLTGVEHI